VIEIGVFPFSTNGASDLPEMPHVVASVYQRRLPRRSSRIQPTRVGRPGAARNPRRRARLQPVSPLVPVPPISVRGASATLMVVDEGELL